MSDQNYLETLQDFYASHRILPSFATIGQLTGLRSKSSVAALVARLKLAGFLDTSPGNRLKPGARFFERIAADSVRAGLPQPVSDQSHDVLSIDAFLIEKPSKTVLVRVKGDSMIDAGVQEGDIVVVEKRLSADIGDMVVAIVDDEFTLKYLDRDKSGFLLRPANPAYAPIRARESFEIFGVVVGLIRKYL
ncbi:MAG TPA: LexA family transcriptional regulator [Burkholderiales bacterium]|nr:LexA family transcriptional regulator [Burkholderiales bacterium]